MIYRSKMGVDKSIGANSHNRAGRKFCFDPPRKLNVINSSRVASSRTVRLSRSPLDTLPPGSLPRSMLSSFTQNRSLFSV